MSALTTFLLVIHAILALVMIVLILMQKSEGAGGLTGGSQAGGLVSARGASNILSRSTAVVATLFIITSLTLAYLAGHSRRPKSIDTSLARTAAPVTQPVAPPVAPADVGPDADAITLPAPAGNDAGVPLAD